LIPIGLDTREDFGVSHRFDFTRKTAHRVPSPPYHPGRLVCLGSAGRLIDRKQLKVNAL
jgi:hypothetical protein